MKIENIEIQNFKSIQHAKINNCKRINLFVGEPNAGKSNLLEAISLCGLNQSFLGKQLTDFVRYNDVLDLTYNGNLENETYMKINSDNIFRIERIEKSEDPAFPDLNLRISMVENFEHNFLQSLLTAQIDETKNILFLNGVPLDKYALPIKTYKYKEGLNFINGNETSLMMPDGKNLGYILSQNSDINEFINKELKQTKQQLITQRLDNGIIKPIIVAEASVNLQQQRGYNLLADTFRRIIFYLAAVKTNKKQVLLFEEPEANCYEPYVLELTNAIKFDKNENQYFIVTHSDYILQEFLREEEFRYQTNIYLVGNNNGNGTVVKLLDRKKNDEVYKYGLNLFFNFKSLWENN